MSLLAVKKHPSRSGVYVDGKAALHPALHREPWLYFLPGEYTRTFEGLVVPLDPQTKPKLLHRTAPTNATRQTDTIAEGTNK